MKTMFLTTGTAIALACGATNSFAQTPPPVMLEPPVVQVQANPPGFEPASPVPPNPATASEPVPPAMPADPGYAAGPYKGALSPPPPEAMNKVYPVCTRTLRDSCRNPGTK